MFLTIMLLLKIGLFNYLTKIEYNKALIFSISGLITVFIFTFIYFSRNRRKNGIAFFFYCLMSGIMFVDTIHYHYFNSLPSTAMLKQIGQVGALGDSVKSIINPINILFVIDIPFIFLNSLRKRRKNKKKVTHYNKEARIGVPLGILATIILVFTMVNLQGYKTAIERQELYTYHVTDIVNYFKSKDIDIEEGDTNTSLRNNNSVEERKYHSIGKDKNLLIIQVEALQNFVVDHFYDGQEITPNINKLLKEEGSLYFSNYYQLTGIGNTSDSEFVTQNSLYPSLKESSYVLHEDKTFYGLPWILRDEGYTSWVFHGYKPEFWNRDKAYPNQGFERFISEEDFNVGETIGFGIIDEDFFQQSILYIKEMGEPFYSFMITLTSHHPFNMPEKYQVLNIRKEHKDTLLGNYLQSIHYADKALGEFIEDLKEEGLYDNTVIALYGDHFALSSEDNKNVKIMTEYLGHKYDFQDMMNIPLIIHVPEENIRETIPTVGSQLDFLPTILNIMGIENKKGTMFGVDLINSKDNLIAHQMYMPKGSFIDNEKQFTMSKDGIFKNSRCHSLKTRKAIDIKECRENYEKSIKEINLSDYILKNDLVIEYVQGQENTEDTKDKKGLNIENMKYVNIENTNIKEALDKAYEEGSKVIEVDLHWTDDDNILELEDITQWMRDHEDVYIVPNIDKNQVKAFHYIKENYEDIQDRIIPQIHNMANHYHTVAAGYDNIVLNTRTIEYTDEVILDFVDRYELIGIIISKEKREEELVEKLKEKDISIYFK